MSNVGTQINDLLSQSNISAPNITNPLKKIGDGNMLQGLKALYDFAYNEGAINEISKYKPIWLAKGGIIGAGIVGLAWVAPKGVKLVRIKLSEKRDHEIQGEKILSSLQHTSINESDSFSSDENVEYVNDSSDK